MSEAAQPPRESVRGRRDRALERGEEPELFDEAARDEAARHGQDSHFRWLVRSDDADAAALRAALQRAFVVAGPRRHLLALGLRHERWGQHAGALAHLLALLLLEHEGLDVVAEPRLGHLSPDVLARHGAFELLVEVRAITGCGEHPWDAEVPTMPGGLPPDLLPAPGEHRRDDDARRRARRRAAERAKARAALARDLSESVLAVIRTKAEAYAELTAQTGLPYVITLYEDTDREISRIVRTWVVRERGLLHEGDAMAHVSGLLVFGRDDAHGTGRLVLRGELFDNPIATRPLPDDAPFRHVARWRARDGELLEPEHGIVPFVVGRA